MTILDYIKTNPLVVGGIAIGVFLIVGGTIVFFVFRGIKRKVQGLSPIVEQVSVPVPEFKQAINILNQEISQRPRVQPGVTKMAMKKPSVVGVPRANMVNLDALSTEDLEQLLNERKAQGVADQKRNQLMMMTKEDLVQLIIDSQVEF